MAKSWFWNPGDSGLSAAQIAAQVAVKLEQGSNMILNVPPNASGVVEDDFVVSLSRVGAARRATFGDPRAALPTPVAAVCAALSVTLPVNGTFDTILLSEDLVAGQVIGSYTLEVSTGGVWRLLAAGVHGMTVGTRLLDAVGPQSNVSALRWNCSSDLTPPDPPPSATVSFRNPAGACLGLHPNASWPCYKGGEGPFSVCPLVAAPCASPGAVAWVEAGGTFAAPGVAQDAVVNVDCVRAGARPRARELRPPRVVSPPAPTPPKPPHRRTRVPLARTQKLLATSSAIAPASSPSTPPRGRWRRRRAPACACPTAWPPARGPPARAPSRGRPRKSTSCPARRRRAAGRARPCPRRRPLPRSRSLARFCSAQCKKKWF